MRKIRVLSYIESDQKTFSCRKQQQSECPAVCYCTTLSVSIKHTRSPSPREQRNTHVCQPITFAARLPSLCSSALVPTKTNGSFCANTDQPNSIHSGQNRTFISRAIIHIPRLAKTSSNCNATTIKHTLGRGLTGPGVFTVRAKRCHTITYNQAHRTDRHLSLSSPPLPLRQEMDRYPFEPAQNITNEPGQLIAHRRQLD